MTAYDDVLVPTDGSGSARRATDHAVELAARYGATVHALYVLDDRYLSGDVEGVAEVSSVESALQAEGEAAVDRIVERAHGRGLAADGMVCRGVPARAVVAAAEEVGADLVAMGTHGRTGIGRLLLGSVAERVVRTAPVPVLTARTAGDEAAGEPGTPTEATTDYDTVVVPTDGSEGAVVAAERAVDLAATYDADVRALSVVDTRLSQASPLFGSFRSVAADAVEAVADLAAERGLDASTAIVEGTPAAAIVGHAEEVDADLVAMGTHGRTGLDRFTIGSVAERVVRTAEVPVLTVRHPETREER
ncbi:MAG: universal stress protein [Halobacteriaceae archaeon]